MEATTIKRADSWFRGLKGGRLEVSLVGVTTDGVPLKMRASGAEAPIWKVVEMFEEMTGCAVEAEWRRPPRTGPRPMAGQLDLTEALTEVAEDGA